MERETKELLNMGVRRVEAPAGAVRARERLVRGVRLGLVAAFGAALAVGLVPILAVHAAGKPIQVVTTTEDLAAIAREVGGDRVAVSAICRGYQDPHFVDAKPSYMVLLKKADLFVEIGRDLEVGWAPPLLNGARNSRILPGAPGFVDASSQVQVIEIPSSVSRAQGDVHPFGNPHYWLDPMNGVGIARAIRDGLARISPGDAALFAQRCADFEKRVTEGTARWKAQARTIGLTGIRAVTYHRSWSYFARAFGFEVVDFVEPRPGIPPSPNHVAELTAQMKQGGIRLLVMEDFFDPRLPQKISKDTGVPLVILPTSVGADEKIKNYFDLFDELLARIGSALKGGKS
ncbi:MAG TPA: metal ABC transporter substrate-binding protein [Candidatus Eisenbacteria bacterium]|jgi:zinc/manganese transport system substrate-binding protein